jgi:hypothetical protein
MRKHKLTICLALWFLLIFIVGFRAGTNDALLDSMLGLTLTNGDMIYASSSTAFTVIDNGTSGQVLTANGAAAPTWSSTLSLSFSGAEPEALWRDTDAAGADATDEDAASIKANMTTTTEDGEISDMRFTIFGASAAGTEYTWAFWDSSTDIFEIGVQTDATQPLTVAGNECLAIDTDVTTDNEVTFGNCTSSSGLTTISMPGIGLKAPMEITAKDVDGETIATADLNTVRMGTGAADWDLPADSCDAATGNWLTLVAASAVTLSITSLDTSDQFVLTDGTVLTADDELDTGGSKWDSCTVMCVDTNLWLVVGERGTCADGGVAD